MAENKIIPPHLVIKTLERGVALLESNIDSALQKVGAIWQDYQDACDALDSLRERKDQYTQAIRLLQ